MAEKTLLEKLVVVQSELKAPKGQRNNFGNYDYRSCEDILEAVKPLLAEQGLVLILSDELVLIGERYYIKATADLAMNGDKISVPGYAREEESKKGMDGSQITGASSSYARKYALNGLFLIDDAKDSDHTNEGKDKGAAEPKPKAKPTADDPAEVKKKHRALEAEMTRTGTDREKVREQVGKWRKVHPSDEGFADIHLNQLTLAEYTKLLDKLKKKPAKESE